MALKNPFAIKTVFDNTDLELRADPGESFLIKDILISNPLTNYITLRTEKTTVGYFRVGGELGSHLPFKLGKTKHSHDLLTGATAAAANENGALMADSAGNEMTAPRLPKTAISTTYKRALQENAINTYKQDTLLKYLMSKDVFKGYPVANGETFKITGAAQSGAIQAIIYEIYDADDQKSDAENGSHAKEFFFINYGRPAAAINTTVDTLYDTTQTPSEFPAFPYDKIVPAKTELDLIGILASDICIAGDAISKYTYSKYLKMIFDREVLFDEDRNGIPHVGLFAPDVANLVSIGEGKSLFGNYSTVDAQEPFLFPEPLKFAEGDELNIYLSTVLVSTGGSISAARAEIGAIMKSRRVA
jgi:hypothetical protein